MLLDAYGSPFPSAAPISRARVTSPQAMSAFFATQHSESRKQLWTLNADPSGQVTSYVRDFLDRHAQTLVANSGLAAAVRPLARLIGYLKPQARTEDEVYNQELEDAFARVAGSPLIFDAAGADDFYTYQIESTEARLIRGDLFTVFTETTTGAARVAARGAHTVGGQPYTAPAGTRWNDGILTDLNGFPLAYHFQSNLGEKGQVLDAVNVFHHRQRHALGAPRGISVLSLAMLHIRDIIETTGSLKNSIKNSSEIAITKKSAGPAGMPPASIGLSGGISHDPYSPPDAIPAGTDAAPLPPLAFEKYVQSGIFSEEPLDVLHDDRPHPNILAFKDSLIREWCAGFGVPHQIMYAMDDPGGAWSRTLIDMMARFIGDQYLRYIRPFCRRFWAYAISKEIKSGRLRPPPANVSLAKLWNVKWTPPKSLTADLARMGKLNIDMRKALLTTFSAVFEELGLDWEDEITQGAREIAFCRQLEASMPGLQKGDLTSWILPAGAPPPPQDQAEAMSAISNDLADLKALIQSRLMPQAA